MLHRRLREGPQIYSYPSEVIFRMYNTFCIMAHLNYPYEPHHLFVLNPVTVSRTDLVVIVVVFILN